MFGQFGQLAGLLKNAARIKQGMAEMNDRLAAARFAGQSGGGQVAVVVDGRGELVSIRIDAALTKSGDNELLEDLVVAAMRDAVRASRETLQKEMEQITGGIDLGDISKLVGGQP